MMALVLLDGSTHSTSQNDMISLETISLGKPVLGEVARMCDLHPCEFIFTQLTLGMLSFFVHLYHD